MSSTQHIKREYIKYPMFIKRWNGRFYKGLITKGFVFFCNYNEGDDNGNVEMYTRNMELVSDNYFASVGLHEALESGEWEYMSPTMKQNYKLALEAGQFE
jgi:hypothetical protein